MDHRPQEEEEVLLKTESSFSFFSFPVLVTLLLTYFILKRTVFAKRRKHFFSGLRREVFLPQMVSLKQHVTFDSDTGSTFVRPSEGVNVNPDVNLSAYKNTGPYIGCDPSFVSPIRTSAKGVASLPPRTVMDLFARSVKRSGDKLAMKSESGKTWTYVQYVEDIRTCARSLLALQFASTECINIMGFNCPEWLILNLGAIFAGGMAAGVYASNNAEQCAYQAQHSKAKIIAVENQIQLEKYLGNSDLTHVRAFVCWDETVDVSACVKRSKGIPVFLFSTFMELGRNKSKDEELNARIAACKPGNICTLIYTSGTTGKPKAVSCTHDNVVWISASTWANLAGDDDLSNEERGVRIVSFLPLSHIAAQLLDIYAPLFCTAYLETFATLYFADANALKGSLLNTLLQVRPTHFFGVPRVWEKFQAKMVEKGSANSFIKKKLVAWARSKGMEMLHLRQFSKTKGKVPFMWFLAKKLLLKARENSGLDCCRVCLSGAAPINATTLEFFGSLDIPVLELYGMSECTGPTVISHQRGEGSFWIHGCGVPLPGTELWIKHVNGRDKAGEGEICFRGRHIMPGYLYDEEKSLEAIDAEGWLHSGDVGRVNEFGNVTITGRIKEILIGSGGENVAPVPVEERIKASLTLGIANVVMCGDKQKYFVLLCTPKCVPDGAGFSSLLDADAKKIDPRCTTALEASQSDKWRAYVNNAVQEYNSKFALSQACKIQKFVILPLDFSVQGDELGPTLKLKRNVVYEKYRAEIESMYTKDE